MILLTTRNKIQGVRLISWIITRSTLIKFNTDNKLDYYLKKWKKKGEVGHEIFKKPLSLLKVLSGDCDDWTTFLISLAKQKGYKKLQILYFINDNNSIYHIAPVIDNNVYDVWKERNKFNISLVNKYYKTASKIILINIPILKEKRIK